MKFLLEIFFYVGKTSSILHSRGENKGMPLKIICKECGEVIYKSDDHELQPIPDIIYEKLHGKCPKCQRNFQSEDLENFLLKVTGEKGNIKWFSRHAKKEEMLVVFTTSKKERREGSYLVRKHNLPVEFEGKQT